MIITKEKTRNNPWNDLYISKVKKMTEGEGGGEEGGGGGGEGGNGEKFLNCNPTKLLKKLDSQL